MSEVCTPTPGVMSFVDVTPLTYLLVENCQVVMAGDINMLSVP